MRSYLCLIFSALCFLSGAAVAYELVMQPDESAFLVALGDAAGATTRALRSAGFFLLGAMLLLGVVFIAVWLSARAGDAKLREAIQAGDESTPSEPNYGIKETARSAFTLIELLVVIAIIAVLAALLMAGVMAVMGKGPELQTRNELMQLQHAIEKFKTEHGVYPPDRFVVYPNRSQYTNTMSPTPQLDAVSLTYLSRIWPNIGSFNAIPWAGPGVPIPANGYILEGDQCLVFFLAGPPAGGSPPTLMGGFSTNPLDPVYAPPYTPARPALDRKRYYDFDAGRLVFRASANPSTSVFPSFKDPYQKQVYAYFNSYKRENFYAPTAPGNWWSTQTPNTLGITPYAKSPGSYYAASTFQLISAGQDGIFGSGGIWPGAGVPKDVQDNMVNFHDRKLVAP